MSQERIEGFLGRWSRLKQAGRTGEAQVDADISEAEAGRKSPASEIDQQTSAAPSEGEVRGEAEAQKPEVRDFSKFDFDSLGYDSDYEQFMEADVPDDVRNTALRKLWVSNPVLANMDGLDDYCEDYTDAAVCLPKGMMKTAYRFGRGFLSDEEVAEWEALGKPVEETEVTAVDPEAKQGAEEAVASKTSQDDWSDTAATSGAACAAALKAEEAEAEAADETADTESTALPPSQKS